MVIEAIGCLLLVFGELASVPIAWGLGLASIVAGTCLMVVQLLSFARRPVLSNAAGGTPGANEPGVLYSDSLVRLSEQGIAFLTSSSRTVPYSAIESVQSLEPTLRNGKWRIWGTGTLSTWFVFDGHRPSRDRIFVATIKGQTTKLGFTAEDSSRVETILRSKGLIRT